MIKVEIRQNEKFKIGYPYHSSVDEYFQNLSDGFIKNYGLDDKVVLKINDHKNKTQQFDQKLHESLQTLSKFVFEFEKTGKKLISDYDELFGKKMSLIAKKDDNLKKYSSLTDEFDFVTNSIKIIDVDVLKVEDFIKYYQSQLVDDRLVYSTNYIDETIDSLIALENLVEKNRNNIDFYTVQLNSSIENLSQARIEMKDYDFKNIVIRDLYEEWSKRKEPYYISLTELYRSRYEDVWTYGSSMIYGEKDKTEKSTKKVVDDVVNKIQESLVKLYNTNIEITLKQYSLDWLQGRTKFEDEEFIYVMGNKKVELLKKEIEAAENIFEQNKDKLRRFVRFNEEQDYFKYRELVMEKEKYFYMHKDNHDEAILLDFDVRLKEFEVNYFHIVDVMTREKYWQLFYDYTMYQELIVELNRQLIVAEQSVSRKFVSSNIDNSETMRMIDFYLAEKHELVSKKGGLLEFKVELETEKKANEYNRLLIEADILEIEKEMLVVVKLYEDFFNKRKEYFLMYSDMEDDELDSIVRLTTGVFKNYLTDLYDAFINYSSDVYWYDTNDRNNLISYYSYCLEKIKYLLNEQWRIEFSTPVNNLNRIVYFDNYFDREIRVFYAHINKCIITGVYQENLNEELVDMMIKLKSIFVEYVEIAFELQKDISVISDIFDYNKKHTFTITKGNENLQDVVKTVNTMLDKFLIFANEKNEEFKIGREKIEKIDKVNLIWLDMEKKYV